MVGPGLAGGTHIKRKAVLWLSISNHRMDRYIGHPTIDRPGYRCAGFWYPDGGGIWPTGRMARYLYQYMAAGAPMEPL
ncbi:hypothetical protein CLV99_1760 [Sphingobacterium yanglingense]|uniref:Uncharacterized protein n=1 Tax=Sphingobacterium yanglingense TaxID=1437280 RepID=A0A4R6WJ68_9SPHI|nr:hypothetical protein CLV99_1760 [Sphingobacterium yanglingense]